MRPLEGRIEAIYEVEGGPVPMAYITKRHVDKDEFAREVLCEFGAVASMEHVEHIYARNTPWRGPDGWVMVMYQLMEPGRGAYALTSVEQGWTTGGTP